jgi:predicted HicB family RNase H-like nuclease
MPKAVSSRPAAESTLKTNGVEPMALAERLEKARSGEQRERRIRFSMMVRVPLAMHKALKDHAWKEKVSLNDLCVASLEETIAALNPEPAEQQETILQ